MELWAVLAGAGAARIGVGSSAGTVRGGAWMAAVLDVEHRIGPASLCLRCCAALDDLVVLAVSAPRPLPRWLSV